MIVRSLLLALSALAGLPVSVSWQRATGPRLDNLTESEIKYAKIYWNYSAAERVLPGVQMSRDSQSKHGYRFVVPLPERLAGLTYVGHAARLRLVLERARNGEALMVAALGGSITFGQAVGGAQGSYVKTFMDWLNAALPPHTHRPRRRVLVSYDTLNSQGSGADVATTATAAAAAVATGDGGQGGQSDYMRTRTRTPQHEFLNGAVPGTQSAYMSSCLHHHLPPEVDLVLVEYAANDSPAPRWTFADPNRRAMERLIRKLLGLASRPAVLLINMYAIGAAHGNYLHTAERDFMEFATYYSLPSVSLKAAVMPSAAVGGAEAVSYGAIFNGGHNHPGRGGHVLATELLITMCLDLLRSNRNSDDSARCDPWVTSAIDDDDVTAAVTAAPTANLAAAAAAAAAAVAALEAVAARPLPPPLSEGNYEATGSTCHIEQELWALAQQPVDGWNWTDEGRGKWGYVATEPGKTIRFKVNTQLGGNRTKNRLSGRPIVVQVAYLESYQGMGTARVSCEAGCTCTAVTIDSYDKRPVSLTSMKDISVSQHPECILALTTKGPSKAAEAAALEAAARNETTSGDSSGSSNPDVEAAWSKFKVLGVVVGEEPGASEGGVTWLRDESHHLANALRDMRG